MNSIGHQESTTTTIVINFIEKPSAFLVSSAAYPFHVWKVLQPIEESVRVHSSRPCVCLYIYYTHHWFHWSQIQCLSFLILIQNTGTFSERLHNQRFVHRLNILSNELEPVKPIDKNEMKIEIDNSKGTTETALQPNTRIIRQYVRVNEHEHSFQFIAA